MLEAELGKDYVNSVKNGWFLTAEDHIQLHSNRIRGKELTNWNAEWEKFLSKPQKEADILKQLESMKNKYGLVGKTQLGAAVADIDGAMTYDKWLPNKKKADIWRPPAAEAKAAEDAFAVRKAAKKTAEKVEKAVENSKLSIDDKTKVMRGIKVLQNLIIVGGAVTTVASFNYEQFIADLKSAQRYLDQVPIANDEADRAVVRAGFVDNIRAIMVNHLGYPEAIAADITQVITWELIDAEFSKKK
jgi:hypothetical protein